MWLPLGVGNVVCVKGVVYVWSDLFQSVSSPPFSGMYIRLALFILGLDVGMSMI